MTPADLGAFVISLRATEALTVPHHMGRAAQQVCLDLVRRVDPTLSEAIHALSQTKPYAVSGLLRAGSTEPVQGPVRAGEGAWLRMVGLRADVVAALDAALDANAGAPSATLEIDRVQWAVESVWADEGHPWAGRATLVDLLHTFHAADPPRKLALEFASPTGFHSAGLNVPLPEPSLVWGSLLRQWNDLSVVPLPDALIPFFAWRVMLNRYRAETHILRFKQGSQQIGFTGRATYAIAGRNVQLERTDPALAESLAEQGDDLARAMGLLTAFAFYCGVGIKTTTGMGMTRAV